MKKVSNIIKMCFGYNNALLSGSMDIIVVKQPSGKLKASPLRLRFSNYRVPKAGKKKVTVKVNQKIVDVPMFLQKDGTGFILLENKKYKKENSINTNQINNNIKEKSKNKSVDEPRNEKHASLYLSPNPRNNIPNLNKINDSIDNDNRSCGDADNNSITLTIDEKKSKEKDFINEEKSDEEIVHNIKTIIVEKAPPPPELKLDLSDCWDTISKNKNNKNFNMQGEFIKKIVSKEQFFKDPWKVINNPNLAIKYKNQILTSKVIIPMMFSQLVYGSPLPEDVVNNLTEGQDGHFFWKTKHKDAYRIDLEQLSISSTENDSENKNLNYNSDGGLVSDKYDSISDDHYSDSASTSDKNIKKKFKMKKSSKIPSHILEKFELKEGTNEIQYIVDGYTINSNIYLWNYSDKIVISDFDGTVTRSDVIGQIGVYFGLDWTHKYIAKLYSHIANNGYKMLYVTARTMYMQKSTKNSLNNIKQDGFSMPDGPMMMNESGYVDAIKTEIIDKVPQEFKIECLLNLLKLFPSDVEPYYAGFGNKPSDKIAYEKIGIDPGKIYIINEKGEVSKNFRTNCKTNFLLMDEQIDTLFPYVYDNGYNSIFYSDNIVNNYLPNIKNIIDEKEMEDEIKDLLK